MTDFKKAVKSFVDLMSMGSIEKIEIYADSDFYVIETEEEIFRYDIITEKRVF